MEIAERYCSFCGAPREETEFLIVDDGKTISICGGCVERSRDFIGHGRIAKEFSEFIKDAERYRWLKRYNKLDGWNDENIDRDIAIEAAVFAQTGAEVK